MTEVRLPASVKGERCRNLREDGADKPGSFAYAVRYGDDSGRKCGLFYRCPCGCGRDGYVGFKPPSKDDLKYGRDTWDWDGNEDAPTLKPSILKHDLSDTVALKDCPTHWHGFLHAGMWEQA